jgi:hypothetical protein
MQKASALYYFMKRSGTVHRQAARTACTQETPETRAGMLPRADYTGLRHGHDHDERERAQKTGGTP